MPRVEKSRKRRISFTKLPGGRIRKESKGKTRSAVKCAKCGCALHGIPRDASRLSKSFKTVNRPFGGCLCSGCTREEFKARVRA